MMWIVSGILLVLFAAAARRAKDPVPSGLRNLLEVLLLFVRDEIARKNIAHGADRYVGFLATTFFFILVCNLAGLVPGAFTATGVISVTASLASVSFLMISSNCSGVVGAGNEPNRVSRSFTSSICSAAATSLLTLARMSRGVPAESKRRARCTSIRVSWLQTSAHRPA